MTKRENESLDVVTSPQSNKEYTATGASSHTNNLSNANTIDSQETEPKKVRIASVSYLNSVQFNYGIESSGLIDAELTAAPPSECSRMLKEGEVDIALIPVGALDTLGEDFEIITSFCIGASGSVRTVVMVSDEEINNIKRIYLDPHSQTSVRLLAHLCEHHFKIKPKWQILKELKQIEHAEDGDAFLLIGDKVFDHEGLFEYSYDLSEEWQRLTMLPFVFAVWCAPREIDESIISELEEALEWGVERTFEAMQHLRPDIDIEDGYCYLTENIDPLLDSAKIEAMRLFRASKSRIELTI